MSDKYYAFGIFFADNDWGHLTGAISTYVVKIWAIMTGTILIKDLINDDIDFSIINLWWWI